MSCRRVNNPPERTGTKTKTVRKASLECTERTDFLNDCQRQTHRPKHESSRNFVTAEISEVEMKIHTFKLGSEIFSRTVEPPRAGSYGEVHFYRNERDSVQLAIKYFNDEKNSNMEAIVVNYLNNNTTNRCSVIPGRVYKDSKVGVCIIMEKADTLEFCDFHEIKEERAKQAMKIVNTVFQQVQCLAELKINGHVCYYTDLKPDNVLVKGEKVMLGDLGSLAPYSDEYPDIYMTTHWLPIPLTGTYKHQLIKKSQVKTCISYLLAMLEAQIIGISNKIDIDLYMREWWHEHPQVWRWVEQRSEMYRF